MMVEIESIDYVREHSGRMEYRSTTVSGETHTVLVETYYSNDHTLIVRAESEEAPHDVVDAVEQYVQEEYDI